MFLEHKKPLQTYLKKLIREERKKEYMNRFEDILIEFAVNSEPKTDEDLDTLYRFAQGNRHPLSELAESVTFDEFRDMYRKAEQIANEQ